MFLENYYIEGQEKNPFKVYIRVNNKNIYLINFVKANGKFIEKIVKSTEFTSEIFTLPD
jgi:hypothetical protein